MRWVPATIICSILCLVSIRVEAESSIESRIAECSNIRGELDRLECFDSLSKDLGLGGSQRTEEKRVGSWIVTEDVNPIDDSRTVALMLSAESGRSARGGIVVLIARCKSNRTEVYIDWDDYLGDDSNSVYQKWKHVTIRIGDHDAKEQRWSLSTNGEATFAPDWAGSLLKQMIDENRLVVQTTPYAENPNTAIFNISGLKEAIKPLTDACNWSFE